MSDRSWRIFRRADPRLLRGLALLAALGGEEPKLWQWPPTGRWRLDRLAPRPDLRPADPLFGRSRCPHALRFPSPGLPWFEVPQSPGCTLPGLSDQSLWDFGEEVEGVLEMGLSPSETPQPALLYFVDEEPLDLEKGAPR